MDQLNSSVNKMEYERRNIEATSECKATSEDSKWDPSKEIYANLYSAQRQSVGFHQCPIPSMVHTCRESW